MARINWVAAAFCLAAVGCGSNMGWEPMKKSAAPDGKATAALLRRCSGQDCQVRVQLELPGADPKTLVEKPQRYPRSPYVVWAADSSRFAAHVCARGGPDVAVGFDAAGAPFSEEDARAMLRERLAADYKTVGDPLLWACTPAGVEQTRAAK